MREQKKRPAPDFDLVAIKIYQSDEPEYEIDFVRRDQTYGIQCKHKESYSWTAFRRAVNKKYFIYLADCGQEAWETLKENIVPTFVELPHELGIDGIVEEAINKLVDNASCQIKAWKMMSQYNAIHDTEGDLMMIKTEALCNAVRDSKVPITRPQIGRVLMQQGWVNRVIKLDGKSVRFWIRRVGEVETEDKKLPPEEKKEPPMDDKELF